MSRLTGRVAVVTGASRGIGRAVAAALQAEGAQVVEVSRHTTRGIRCDITRQDDVDRLARETLQQFGPPDLVVNNAGGFLLAGFEATTPEQFAAQLALNLEGPFRVARAFLPAMRARGRGRLVTLGSIADHRALPGNAAYAAAKAGLRALHEVLREEYRGSGVLLSLVSPGPTDTATWDPYDPDRREGFTPRARMLRPEDVAEAVAWIATRPDRVDVDWLRLDPA